MDLREKMLDMLGTTAIKENFALSGDLLIAVSFAAMNNANIYFWGEKDLHLYIRLFKDWDLKIHKVVCALPKDFKMVDDVEIISPENLFTDETPNKVLFVSAIDYSIKNAHAFWNGIMAKVLPLACYFISARDRVSMAFNHELFDIDSMFYYQSHKKDLMELFDLFTDYTSKLALYHYVESYVTNCIYKGEQISTRWKYFFGSKYERLYKHLDGECWVNCGASSGDTIFFLSELEF